MATDDWLDYLHPMKPPLHSFMLLLLAVLAFVPQSLLANSDTRALQEAPCGLSAMATGGGAEAMPDKHCLDMEKCRGGCLCVGCGHCAHAVMPGAATPNMFNTVSTILQPQPVQYTSLNPPPESPPPRHLSC
jgi:hypothetical protein